MIDPFAHLASSLAAPSAIILPPYTHYGPGMLLCGHMPQLSVADLLSQLQVPTHCDSCTFVLHIPSF